MNRRCAWCGVIYGQTEPLNTSQTTHGMCTNCYQNQVRTFREFEGGPRSDPLPDTVWIIKPGSTNGQK